MSRDEAYTLALMSIPRWLHLAGQDAVRREGAVLDNSGCMVVCIWGLLAVLHGMAGYGDSIVGPRSTRSQCSRPGLQQRMPVVFLRASVGTNLRWEEPKHTKCVVFRDVYFPSWGAK